MDIFDCKQTFKDFDDLAFEMIKEVNFKFEDIYSEGVYKIVLEDGCFYIGKSVNIYRRIFGHLSQSEAYYSDVSLRLYVKLKEADKSKIEIFKLSDNLEDEKNIIIENCSEKMLNTQWNFALPLQRPLRDNIFTILEKHPEWLQYNNIELAGKINKKYRKWFRSFGSIYSAIKRMRSRNEI